MNSERPYFSGFNDEMFLSLVDNDTIPIHYLHGHQEPVANDDLITAYWKKHLQGTGRSRTGGKGSGIFRGTNNYPPRNQQHPRAWPSGQHPIFRKPGNQVAGNGLWTHTDPPHWGPMYESSMPLRRYVSEVNLWERDKH